MRIEVYGLKLLIGDNTTILSKPQFRLLLLANMVQALGSALLSPILDSLISPLGTSPAHIGLMMSAFTAPPIFLIPVAGLLADRHGRRPLLIFGLLCFGTAGTGIALTSTFSHALLLRFIQGIGFAALTPIIITSIGDLYSGALEATGQGLRFTSSGFSQVFFPLAAGVLVAINWRYPFVLYAISFPTALAIYLWFEETVDREKTSDGSPTAHVLNLWQLFSQRRALYIVIAAGSPVVVWIGFLTYNSLVIVELLGEHPIEAGIIASLASLAYAIAATQAGRITAIVESRFYVLVAMNGLMAVGTVMFYLAASLWMARIGIFIAGVGFGVLLSLYRSIITNLAPDHLRGGLVGLGEASNRITATLTPIVMGVGIAFLTPRVGLSLSLRVVGVATIAGATIGIVCLYLARRAPPISDTGRPAR